jgi:protein-S-isoprenylcysteine O-methyltransferase Ste14
MASQFVNRSSRVLQFLAYCLAGGVVGAAWARWWAHGGTASVHNWREFVADRARAGFPPGILISIALLCVFSLYWEVAARNSAKNESRESGWSRGIHLVLLSAGQIVLLFPVPGLRTRFLPYLNSIVLVGLILETTFLSLAVWARLLLGSNWSGAVTTKVDHQLIRSGPYRIVRHPIYSALLGAYASIAMVSGEVHALVGLVLICLAYWRKIRLEEQVLGGLFGESYSEYRVRVCAVIPGML